MHPWIKKLSFTLRLLTRRDDRRYALQWLLSQRKDYLLNKPSPWISFKALSWICGRMRPGMRIFEYGSGGSTLYWMSHEANLTSIEHDPEWYHIVNSLLPASKSVDYRLCLPRHREQEDVPADPADPKAYATSDENLSGYNFEKYACAIDAFPDDSFDIVFVDGRSRPSCIFHGCRKVKVGGMLILDNSEREYYTTNVRELLSSFQRLDIHGVIPCNPQHSTTSIYRRMVDETSSANRNTDWS